MSNGSRHSARRTGDSSITATKWMTISVGAYSTLVRMAVLPSGPAATMGHPEQGTGEPGCECSVEAGLLLTIWSPMGAVSGARADRHPEHEQQESWVETVVGVTGPRESWVVGLQGANWHKHIPGGRSVWKATRITTAARLTQTPALKWVKPAAFYRLACWPSRAPQDRPKDERNLSRMRRRERLLRHISKYRT
jgi:hypothetical protein